MCGWLKDRFGFSWQVTPALITEVMGGSDTAKTDRVMAEVMKMRKLDLAVLEAAAEG
jgi:predicted 3-demethylubiquinone-9 3-methyltransferase (glyoxalase superfamily)